jgi:hypothetical protein
MKKLFVLIAFLMIAVIAMGQNSITKEKRSITLTSSYVTAGSDSAIFVLQPQNDWSIQIKPRLGASADSIYTSVRIFVSNSDGDPVWTAINCNDTYTATTDTLVTANASLTTYAAWKKDCPSEFYNVRLKVLLTCLDNTNEDNYYYVYFVAKPNVTWMNR